MKTLAWFFTVVVLMVVAASIAYPQLRPQTYGGIVTAEGGRVRVGARELPANLAEQVRRLEGLPVTITTSLAGTQIVNPGVKGWLAFVSPGLANQPAAQIATLSVPEDRYPSITAAVKAVAAAYEALQAPGNTPPQTLQRQVVLNLKRALTAILVAIDSVPQEHKSTFAAVGGDFAAAFLRPQSEQMRYENAFNRSPATYQEIARDARGAVAIKAFNQRVGSGFLVTATHVLTNRHVVARYATDDLKVVFDYEEDAEGAPLPSIECTVSEAIVSDDVNTDLAALGLDCGNQSVKDRILEFREGPMSFGQELYVIGHPNGGYKQVSDNAFVRYPYRASPGELSVLREGVRAAFEAAVGLEAANVAVRDFNTAYVQPTPRDGYYYYQSPTRRWSLPPGPGLPCFGFDSNTAPGSSGSPVFLLGDFRVAGVFMGGASDDQYTRPYSWYRHEAAIPGTVALAWLRSKGVVP